MFKYLQRKTFVNENCNLGKAFNKEVVPNKKSGWSIKMRHILDSYGMTNFILNTFKELKDKLDKKPKNKCSFSPKQPKTVVNKHSYTLTKLKRI